MNISHKVLCVDAQAVGEVARLLYGLESQRTELGPIADELLQLLHGLGVNEPPPHDKGFTPSHG